MSLAYPAAHDALQLPPLLLALKIARHSPCTKCETCSGLHPSAGSKVVADDSALPKIEPEDLFDIEVDSLTYLEQCDCGHSVVDHGANESELGANEFNRRGRVAIRLDELLQDIGKLLDFDFVNEDIVSLRRQLKIPSSSPDLPPDSRVDTSASSPGSSTSSEFPPKKKRKLSRSTSFSIPDFEDTKVNSEDDDDEEEEDDRPLASKTHKSTRPSSGGKGHSGRKKRPGSKKKGSTAPTSKPQPAPEDLALMNGKNNGVPNGHITKIKMEEKMDEGQLTRLATGLAVDTANMSTVPSAKPEKAAAIELRKGIIKIVPVENDGEPRSRIILTGLKTLFQKQLPKMPREYIARLVYDSNSRALAIIKRGLKVVGGICFRPFPHRGFAEIVFFATASVDQVKGYGGMLMDHFKAHIKKTYPDMMHFLTYADNYAVGYFEKQGFTKEITLDRSVWAGYIKDYEGGTIMQCTMVRKVDYLDKATIFAKQQEAILTKIRQHSKSHIVYPGLPQFQGAGVPPDLVVDVQDVPGLRESGWTASMAALVTRIPRQNPDQYMLERLMRELMDHSMAWPFKEPVDTEKVTDYLEFVEHPMDLGTMQHKLEHNQYPTMDEFVADATLMFENCRKYNASPGNIYHKASLELEKFFRQQISERG